MRAVRALDGETPAPVPCVRCGEKVYWFDVTSEADSQITACASCSVEVDGLFPTGGWPPAIYLLAALTRHDSNEWRGLSKKRRAFALHATLLANELLLAASDLNDAAADGGRVKDQLAFVERVLLKSRQCDTIERLAQMMTVHLVFLCNEGRCTAKEAIEIIGCLYPEIAVRADLFEQAVAAVANPKKNKPGPRRWVAIARLIGWKLPPSPTPDMDPDKKDASQARLEKELNTIQTAYDTWLKKTQDGRLWDPREGIPARADRVIRGLESDIVLNNASAEALKNSDRHNREEIARSIERRTAEHNDAIARYRAILAAGRNKGLRRT